MRGVTSLSEEMDTSLFGGPLKFPICGKLYSLLGYPVTDEMKDKGVLNGMKKVHSDGNPLLEEGTQAVLAPGKKGPKDWTGICFTHNMAMRVG